MIDPFTAAQRQLFKDVLERRKPDLLRRIERAGLGSLSDPQRRDVEGAISDEFVEAGSRPDYEPNPYGLELEYLLDAVLRVFTATPPAA